jgi:hypothetical protein
MEQIVSSQLSFHNIGLFIHELPSFQAETVSGGYIYVHVTNISDGVNSIGNTYYIGDYGFNFHDNKIYTIDYSRSIYNWFYL